MGKNVCFTRDKCSYSQRKLERKRKFEIDVIVEEKKKNVF